MPRLSSPSSRRGSGGERVFSDARGTLWSASYSKGVGIGEEAVVFACVSDARQSVRAISAAPDLIFADVPDDTLREWLENAPKIGRLT